MLKLDLSDKEFICFALKMQQNVIETGDYTLSANDVVSMGRNAPKGIKVRALTHEQMELILTLEKLKEKVRRL